MTSKYKTFQGRGAESSYLTSQVDQFLFYGGVMTFYLSFCIINFCSVLAVASYFVVK